MKLFFENVYLGTGDAKINSTRTSYSEGFALQFHIRSNGFNQFSPQQTSFKTGFIRSQPFSEWSLPLTVFCYFILIIALLVMSYDCLETLSLLEMALPIKRDLYMYEYLTYEKIKRLYSFHEKNIYI